MYMVMSSCPNLKGIFQCKIHLIFLSESYIHLKYKLVDFIDKKQKHQAKAFLLGVLLNFFTQYFLQIFIIHKMPMYFFRNTITLAV